MQKSLFQEFNGEDTVDAAEGCKEAAAKRKTRLSPDEILVRSPDADRLRGAA
jgi:hypothetical protein